MKKNEVEVGGTYTAKVGKRSVEVRIEAENAKGGWNAVSVDTGKPVRIKDVKQLRPASAANDADIAPRGEAEVEQPAPPDETDLVPLDKEKKIAGKGKGRAGKATKAAAPKEKKAKTPKPAKEKAPKKMSALDAAAAVLKAKGEPMRCVDMVAAMKEKGLWETDAPTPAATLYSAILRELSKGQASRFKKTDRGHFGLKD